MKVIYIVYDHGEDGRAPKRQVAAFEDEASAKRIDPNFCTVEAMPVFKNYEDWKENNIEAVQKRALAKLTTEEKHALGLLKRGVT